MKLRMQTAHRNGMAYQVLDTWAPQPESSLPEYTLRFEVMVREHDQEMNKALVRFNFDEYNMRLSYGVNGCTGTREAYIRCHHEGCHQFGR